MISYWISVVNWENRFKAIFISFIGVFCFFFIKICRTLISLLGKFTQKILMLSRPNILNSQSGVFVTFFKLGTAGVSPYSWVYFNCLKIFALKLSLHLSKNSLMGEILSFGV